MLILAKDGNNQSVISDELYDRTTEVFPHYTFNQKVHYALNPCAT